MTRRAPRLWAAVTCDAFLRVVLLEDMKTMMMVVVMVTTTIMVKRRRGRMEGIMISMP